ncbi:hypothetical protein AX17_006157 [Amanita inopinata Kibby_2008]|nr:hypothetical protein AX17_006157 [Amanita inopinata Kibby_2008]
MDELNPGHVKSPSTLVSYPDEISDCEPVTDIPSVRRTYELKRKLVGQDICSKVINILECMKEQGMDLPLFLDALSWGDPGCHSHPQTQYARTALLKSRELPNILERWYAPPRTQQSQKGTRLAGARGVLLEFSRKHILEVTDDEMRKGAPLFKSPTRDITESNLTTLHLASLKDEVKRCMRTFWEILESATRTNRQSARNKLKNPDMYILTIISQCQYSRSNRHGKLQKLWAIYLKACGPSARAFDAIHSVGLSMSHKWVSIAYGTLSEKAMVSAQEAVQTRLCTISHNMPIRAFSQRLHNQSHFVSGTAMTLWALPLDARLPPGASRELWAHRSLHSTKPFDFADVLYGNKVADMRLDTRFAYHIRRFLLTPPQFIKYPYKDSLMLGCPPPTDQLECSKRNIIEQHLLGICSLEEASYDGTLKVMDEAFRQLKIDTEEQIRLTADGRFFAWLGDQLTVERLRGLWRLRHEDHNPFDRMDYMVPVFGWFHLVMTFASSLHKQYLCTSANIGSLRHAFDVLQRKGLLTQSTKGPFWHHLDEAIHHIAEAHLWACWLKVSGAKDIGELTTCSPAQLHELSLKILREHASRRALRSMYKVPDGDKDQVQIQWTMWNKDVLPYIELRDAIRSGDISRMEDLLPTLLFCFAGGGNTKYMTEILELLQGLKCEWPASIRDYIRKYCWLLNRTGEPNHFLLFDLAQEHNITDIKASPLPFHGPGRDNGILEKGVRNASS